jgi:predicted RNase H-like nuclease (RuvC/YqgF family)
MTGDDGGQEEEESTHEERELSEEEKKIKRLERRVERLESHAESLESTIEEKDETIEKYKEELSDAKREERREARERREVQRLERDNGRLERKLASLEEENEELSAKIERLKHLWKLDHSNFADVNTSKNLVPVKVVEQFTKDAIDRADEAYGLSPGDVVYLRDASGAGRSTAERLAETDPRAVLRTGGLSDAADEVLFEHGIPVGPAADVTMQEIDELAVAREADVGAVIDDWERRAEDRRKEEQSEMVDRIISEHRAETRSEGR